MNNFNGTHWLGLVICLTTDDLKINHKLFVKIRARVINQIKRGLFVAIKIFVRIEIP